MEVGDVYTLGSAPMIYRILMFDNIYFFYESIERDKWSFSDYLNRDVMFYGQGVESFLIRRPKFIQNLPYSTLQLSIICPDLPLSMLRHKAIHWHDIAHMKDQEVINSFNLEINESIPVSKIFLIPRGNRGRLLKPILYESKDGNNVVKLNLLRFISEIENINTSMFGDGMGLFRVGWKRKTPTYIIEDYFHAESVIYRRNEEGFDWEKFFEMKA